MTITLDKRLRLEDLDLTVGVEFSGRECSHHDRTMYRKDCPACLGTGFVPHDCGRGEACSCADRDGFMICTACGGKGYFEWCHYCEEEKNQ